MTAWEIRIPFDYAGTLDAKDVRYLEKELARLVTSRRSPLPDDVKVVCVEVVEDCPTCERPKPWCKCEANGAAGMRREDERRRMGGAPC